MINVLRSAQLRLALHRGAHANLTDKHSFLILRPGAASGAVVLRRVLKLQSKVLPPRRGENRALRGSEHIRKSWYITTVTRN